MKKSFLFNLAILFTLNILVKPFWLYMDMQVQNEVGEDYGLYFELLNFASIFNIILDLGINNYNNRKIVSNPNRFSVYFKTASTLRLGLSFLYLLAIGVVGFVLDYSFEEFKILLLLGVSQILLASILFVRSNFTALGKFKIDSLFSITDRVLMIGAVGYLLYISAEFKITVTDFIMVQLICYFITFVLSLAVLYKIGKPTKIKYENRFGKVLLRKSAPYALIVILMSAYHYSDSIMIGRILEDGKFQNAVYAQSFRILMALNNYAYLFAVLLLPMFAKQIKQKENIQSLLGLSSSVLIFGVFAIAGILFFNRNEFLNWCYHSLNTEPVFALLIFGIVPMSVNYCFGALITASGNMSFLNKIAALALVLNIVLNFILIPVYQVWGAALASLITQSFNGLMQVIYSVRKFNLQLKIVPILKFGVSVLLICVLLMFDFDLDKIAVNILLLGLTGTGLLLNINLKGIKQFINGMKAST